MENIDKSTNLFGLNLFSSDEDQLLKYLENHVKEGKKLKTVFTPNPEQVILTTEDPKFKHILPQADILLPDGQGLVWASLILAAKQHQPALQSRITGIDTVTKLLTFAQTQKLTCLLIGGLGYGANGTATAATPQLLQPQLYWVEGYADIAHPTDAETAAVKQALTTVKPDIVWVAFGAPWQEEWVIEHRDWLEAAGVKLAMVVGGSFDALLGKVGRSPSWMQAVGLEWLYRLLQEPWRWQRQTRLLRFIGLTLSERLH